MILFFLGGLALVLLWVAANRRLDAVFDERERWADAVHDRVMTLIAIDPQVSYDEMDRWWDIYDSAPPYNRMMLMFWRKPSSFCPEELR